MTDFYASYKREQDLMHYGRRGMKRGYHLFGDRDYDPIGEPANADQAHEERVLREKNIHEEKLQASENKTRLRLAREE